MMTFIAALLVFILIGLEMGLFGLEALGRVTLWLLSSALFGFAGMLVLMV